MEGGSKSGAGSGPKSGAGLFRREVTIEWGDCDPAGIVYYPRYFAMFDASTAHMIAAATNLKKIELLAKYEAAGFPMVNTGAEFVQPARYGDIVVIESTITQVGRSSFSVAHRLFNNGQLAIKAVEKRVWVKHDAEGNIRSAPLPDAVAAALRDCRGDADISSAD
jgi:4-hydroxybenzoyl-CoA thioesterase